MAIYRPDHIATAGAWRYARAVKTEVAYGDPQCATYKVGICNGHYAQIPAADGVCGPRAFFGRYTRLAFGMPTVSTPRNSTVAVTPSFCGMCLDSADSQKKDRGVFFFSGAQPSPGTRQCQRGRPMAGIATGETAILPRPSLLLAGVSIWMERGCQ